MVKLSKTGGVGEGVADTGGVAGRMSRMVVSSGTGGVGEGVADTGGVAGSVTLSGPLRCTIIFTADTVMSIASATRS